VNSETGTEQRLLGFPYWDPIKPDILNAATGQYDDDRPTHALLDSRLQNKPGWSQLNWSKMFLMHQIDFWRVMWHWRLA